VLVLMMHSEDDQIVPYVAAGPLSAKLLRTKASQSQTSICGGQTDLLHQRPIAELSLRTFWTLLRELSSRRRIPIVLEELSAV
jgi:hypothetical protein